MTHDPFLPADPLAVIASYAQVNLIGGVRVPVGTGMAVTNPATGARIGMAAASNPGETAAAVAAAKAAGPAWAALPARERGRRVAAAGRALAAEAEVVARVLCLETGKAIRTECRGELAVAADLLEFYGGLASELKGETVPFHPRSLTVTTREPLGVVAAILPWNVPLVLMMLKIAPALVAGNTVVVKAAEEAPFATFAAAEILMQYLPDGVLNVVNGDGPDCGAALTAHADIAKITFTGSEEVGEVVYKAGAGRIIPVSLELGGKSPMIICADADLDKTVTGAINGMRFTRQGQSCTAASRIYVHSSLLSAFVDKLAGKLEKLIIGDPMDEATDIGTIISARQAGVIRSYVARAAATPQAIVLRCGTLPKDADLSPDLFMQPTLILGLPEDHPCVQEEIFGPVAVIQAWDNYEEVIASANATRYGLAATVWTDSLSTALDATARLDAGYVQVNQNLTIQPNVSYGGFGRSGLGKEASLEAMLDHFTRKKTIVMNFD
ncbi:aldehyde dehydrogenase family protein [Pseudooceanicola algae]|uniref:NAD/NADP-dependent betaine aldehyde dehydrogenase n=1 Tax=Pseudooceanicola algae TaxID=1537215 RepID=A0A418SG96_9RHOB|nr:aldehyde dehydrogenase family protein [Pseudooceanicola algae]QPM91561.1 NAD/NADP-dependent betaine aldehyde dehydrogenase [Pseudooceanicola algae]